MSKIKVNRIENTSTTDGGVSIDNDGHVTIDGQQLPTAGALSNRNLIINGAMQVAQRGTTITSTGYFIDRFSLETSSGDTVASQLNTTASDTPYTLGFRKHARITNTSGTSASNGFRALRHIIEAQNIAGSGWDYTNPSSYITLSFWVRSSVAQTYSVYLRATDGTAQRYTYTFTLNANTWTKVTQSIPGYSGITIDNDNGEGFQINISPYWGPDFSTSSVTNNAWEVWSGSTRVQDMTNTWATTVGATFDVTGVQLEVGSKATPFEHRSFHDEQLKCMRYFQHFGEALASDDGYDDGFMVFHNWAPTAAYGGQKFIVPMRTRPTLASSGLSYYSGGSIDGSITLDLVGANTNNGELRITGIGGLTQGTSGWLRIAASGAYIHFSAEL